MTRTQSALIIGGGIAGPATALALRKAGIDSVVYESHPNGAEGAGVFLTLASNGIDALRVLAADAAALAAGFPTPRIALRSGTGKRLGETRTGRVLGDGTAGHTVKRADLYRILRDEAVSRGIRIEHGKHLVAAEDTGDGVRAAFSDGTEATGGSSDTQRRPTGRSGGSRTSHGATSRPVASSPRRANLSCACGCSTSSRGTRVQRSTSSRPPRRCCRSVRSTRSRSCRTGIAVG